MAFADGSYQWYQRLGTHVVQDPFSRRMIDLFKLDFIRENVTGERVSCEFFCSDGSVPRTSFFLKDKEMWVHITPCLNEYYVCSDLSIPETAFQPQETMMAERDGKGRFLKGNTVARQTMAKRKGKQELVLHGPKRFYSWNKLRATTQRPA